MWPTFGAPNTSDGGSLRDTPGARPWRASARLLLRGSDPTAAVDFFANGLLGVAGACFCSAGADFLLEAAVAAAGRATESTTPAASPSPSSSKASSFLSAGPSSSSCGRFAVLLVRCGVISSCKVTVSFVGFTKENPNCLKKLGHTDLGRGWHRISHGCRRLASTGR
jgi:hypothetical protein